MTQEFHISVTPVGKDEYLVRTERVAPGVPLAEEQLSWDVEAWLMQAQQLMNDPLLGLLHGYGDSRIGGAKPSGHPEAAPLLSLVKLGQQMYSELFQGTLRDSWVTAQGIAQHRGEVLRLRLGMKGTRLPRLPWEVMHGNEGDAARQRRGSQPARPLATGTEVLFSRYQPSVGMAAMGALPLDQPLRILMAIAAPTDQQQLNLKREASHLQRELRHQGALPEGMAGSLPDIQLTILEQPGREQLTQALEQGQYQVFHFAGHSDLNAAGGSLYLVNHRTGLTEMLSGDDLAGLLVNNDIRMAVFNSCRGAYTAATDAAMLLEERNLAEALVNRGIPAVLAMAEQIPDDVALTLTLLFYRNLKQGYPVDLSLNRARQGLISAYGSDQLYWALPILYLHPDFDGYLTTSDRNFDNPADCLIRLPRQYEPAVASSSGSERRAQPVQDWAVIAETVLSPNDLSLVDELDYSDDAEVELSAEEDRLVVADLIHKLTQQKAVEEPLLPADRDETLLPDPPTNGLEMYSAIPDQPHHQAAAATATRPAPTQAAHIAPVRSPLAQKLTPMRTWLNRKAVLLPLGAASVLTIALISVWWATRSLLPPRESALADLSLPELTVETPDTSDLTILDTPQVTAVAISQFEQGALAEGQRAVAELLDREALPQATAALAAVAPDQIDDPNISFLRGRLAWQAIQKSDTDYSTDDARRYWEVAVKGKPDVAQYRQALGFAYYAEGKSREAIEEWRQAISLESEGQAASSAANGESFVKTDVALTSYAGIALALKQIADSVEPEQGAEFQSQAVKVYQMVIQTNPTAFQSDALSLNSWLWTPKAIEKWEELSKLE